MEESLNFGQKKGLNTKFLLLLLFTPLFSIGQNLDSVTKISFHFYKGHSDWGETQQYATEEIIEFIPKSKKTFICNRFEKIKLFHYKDTSEYGRYKKDTVIIPHYKKFNISITGLKDLIAELSTNRENFTAAYVLPFLKPYSKNEILKLAKSNRKEYLFIDDETKKVDEYGEERIEKIQQYYQLDSFINEYKPNVEEFTIVTDVWEAFAIDIFQKNKKTSYEMRILPMEGMLLGQPIDRRINGSLDSKKRVINLNVNKILMDLLPNKSLSKSAIDFNSIRETYLEWLLDYPSDFL